MPSVVSAPSDPVAGLCSAPAPAVTAKLDLAAIRRLWQIDGMLLARLAQLRPVVEATLAALDETFYEPLFAEESIRLLMRYPAVRQRAVTGMANHWRAQPGRGSRGRWVQSPQPSAISASFSIFSLTSFPAASRMTPSTLRRLTVSIVRPR